MRTSRAAPERRHSYELSGYAQEQAVRNGLYVRLRKINQQRRKLL
jgi:hypothetical protein